MKLFRKFSAALLAAAVVLMPLSAAAQTVVAVPTNVAPGAFKELGNGPTEIRMLQGNMALFTSSGSGVGSTSGSATPLTLTATPTTVPCVGCIISGTGITSGTTVASFNTGTNVIGLSAAMNVASATAVAW